MFKKRFFVVIFLFAGATQIIGRDDAISKAIIKSDIKGRLLTVDDGCGYSKVANKRIVGGSAAKNEAWPWIALLGRRNQTHVAFSCGGTLITSRHILSAAHCFRVDCNFVRLGEYDTHTLKDGKHFDLYIDHVETHEHYNKATQINDIAIVYLVHDVKFTNRIRPICLPTSKELQNLSFVGKMPFVAGWGHLRESTRMTNILQQVQLPVITNDECKQKYKEDKHFVFGAGYRFNETYVLCAGFTAGGKSACQGDSGGPMMLPIFENGQFPYYQIGVVSYGFGCARPNSPAIFTNVQKYVEWINRKLQ